MKRLLTACLLGSIAFAAGAQDASPAEVDAQAETRAQVESDQQTAEAEDKADADARNDCLRYTGSHLATRTLERKGKDCVIANGRVYTAEDIQRTGQTNVADALRMLDPAIH